MRFINENTGGTRSDWTGYTIGLDRTLTGGEFGPRIVYAEFDIDGDGIADIQTSDTINYEKNPPSEGEIKFTILTGDAYCIYGNTLDLGTKGVNNGITTFSGNFNTSSGNNTRSCVNNNGITTQANLTIQMSGDLMNINNVSTFI